MEQFFTAAFFAGNRRALLKELGMGSLIVLTANTQMQRGPDSAFKFEQEANFWYLTGIDAPDWQVIIDGGSDKTWLVAPEIDEVREIFDGSLARQTAMERSGIRDVIDPIEAKRLLGRLHQQHAVAYTVTAQTSHAHFGFCPNPAQRQLTETLGLFRVQDCRSELHRLRAIKQPAELQAMQKAIDITIDGIRGALPLLCKLHHEFEVEAELTYRFRKAGAEGHAYDPIVAAGANACTLHYIDNAAPLTKKDWLLFDVGARAAGYCADITRTVPLGKPTKRQIEVYEATKRVHDAAIKLCKPGQSVQEYQEAIDEAMTQALSDLNLLRTEDDLRHYFPHAISHGLGIDVHDSLGRPVVLAENMVLTVEPGIYIPEEGFGVRIEDDILVSANGPVNLSRKLPTELEKLQALMKRA